MNNLLRTLTESQVKSSFPETDLKLLLNAVKDSRRQSYDTKLADPFYDSLEGLLQDLRTVTMDNRDAEAFLKPVLKSDVPDYYDVISNPMDMQTMLKKVKQKQYKTKKEFKDDLDLIWNNCYTYNAAKNHPLRLCAKRLQLKAQKLLKNITDRKDRTDPSIPSDLCGVHPKINGFINGHSRHHSPLSKPGTPTIKHSHKQRRDIPFSDTPAIIRTSSSMSTFQQLDQEVDRMCGSSKSAQSLDNGKSALAERLRDFLVPVEYESDSDDVHSPENGSHELEDGVGEKRKPNGIAGHRVRKRARIGTQAQTTDRCENIVDLWWQAVVSDTLIASGVPSIPCASSRRSTSSSKTSRDRSKLKPKKHKPSKKKTPPQSLLSIMNDNIRTMKRVRRTHAKFATLHPNTNHEDSDWSAVAPATLGDEAADDVVDDRPWRPGVVGVEMGEENASDCMHWMGSKVLEHAGFQGSSKIALDVLASVTSEYLLNVGRTIRFLCDKYSNGMTAEEIILHTLFESGTSKIQDLERYIKDDVIRYGSRLGDLEKKLVSAYREVTVTEALDDDALFGNEEDGEEEGAFVMGNFADNFGEDFLGLRELGIAAEYGLSSLTIPKRLLKGKGRGENKLSSSSANPAEPPPPFPPPPPFVTLNSTTLEDQIGLLKPFYQERFVSLTTFTPAIPPLPSPAPFGINLGPHPQFGTPSAPAPSPSTVLTVLPDDPPDPSRVKMGPLGQIIKVLPSTGASKKKTKRKDAIPGLNGNGGLTTPGPVTATASAAAEPATPKKKKMPGAATTVGNKKKKVKMAESMPPVIAASA